MKYQLAVDVGSCYVKLVEGYEKNGKFILQNIGYFPNPHPELRTSLIEREQDSFVKSFRDFIQKHGIREKRAVSGVSGAGVITHYFDIPRLSDAEVKSAIELEMMQVTPGGTRNLEYDYLVMPRKDGRKIVFFVGYQKDRCEFFTKTLQRSGLKPLIMDHDSLAALNCFNFFNRKHTGPRFILNCGRKNTNFVLAEGKDGFILVRDIPFGGKHLIESVAKIRNISREDAEIYVRKKENAEELKEILASDLEDLHSEVRAGLEFFKIRSEKSPDTLYLTGGVATIPGICEAFEKNLDIKTAIWNPLEYMTNTKTFLIPEDVKKRGCMFTVALGLALRKIK